MIYIINQSFDTFTKWTMITLASFAISLTVGLVLMQYAHGQSSGPFANCVFGWWKVILCNCQRMQNVMNNNSMKQWHTIRHTVIPMKLAIRTVALVESS